MIDDTDATTDPIHVLHVDDDPDFAGLTAEFLEREYDLTVTTATSASEGLDRLVTDEFDCIVSDYDMPGMTGLELLESVREVSCELPFILFTGKGSEEVASDAISAGVTDYLQKEIGVDQYTVLANRIRNYVERARAQREREAMRERMEHALEHTDSVIFEVDLDTGAVRRFGEFERFFDLSPDEVPTWEDHLEDAVHPDDREAFRRFHRQLVAGERDSGTLEYRTNPDTGSVRWIRNDFYVAGGEPRRAIGLSQDITERRQYVRRLETLVDNLPGMVYRCQNERGWPMETVRGEIKDLTGYSPSEIERGDGIYGKGLIHPDDRDGVWDAVQDALDAGEAFELTYRIHTKGGDTRWVWERGQGIYSDAGDVEALEGFITDITERKEREQELRQVKERLQAFTENTSDVITLIDEAGVIQYQSPSVECVLGYEPESLVGQNAFEYIHPDDRETAWATFTDLIEHPGTSTGRAEYRFEHADGSWVWLESLGSDRTESALEGYVIMSRDISERKERERERQNERLADFAGLVSHDLQTPHDANGHDV